AGKSEENRGVATAASSQSVSDPVCGMTVDPARAADHVEHAGRTFYFCSKGCAAKFRADPDRYLAGRRDPMAAHSPIVTIGGLTSSKPHAHTAAAAVEPPSAATYTCPMHPEVVSDRPGSCPKC